MEGSGTIWVTGAAGFIGTAVCRALLAEGHDVRPVLRRGARVAVDGHDAPGSLLKPLRADLSGVCPGPRRGESRPRAIVHLAAGIPRDGGGEEMAAVAQQNRRIDDNVFALAAAVGAGVVFASSGSVYGDGSGDLFVEDGPVAPTFAYAAAKLRSEQLGAEMLAAAALPFTALRISAPYGPGLQVDTVTRVFMIRALAGRPLRYHGDGSRAQDFVYVDDVASAVTRAATTGVAGVFNIASGESVTMKELAATVAEVAGRDVEIVSSGRPDAQEGRTARYSIAAAEKVLGWQPSTSLRGGLERWRDRLLQERR